MMGRGSTIEIKNYLLLHPESDSQLLGACIFYRAIFLWSTWNNGKNLQFCKSTHSAPAKKAIKVTLVILIAKRMEMLNRKQIVCIQSMEDLVYYKLCWCKELAWLGAVWLDQALLQVIVECMGRLYCSSLLHTFFWLGGYCVCKKLCTKVCCMTELWGRNAAMTTARVAVISSCPPMSQPPDLLYLGALHWVGCDPPLHCTMLFGCW